MNIKHKDTFEYGRKISKVLMITAIALSVASVIFPAESVYKLICVIGSLLCVAASLIAIYNFCRCPYCGKKLFLGVLNATHCPSCRRNLKTGKKSKK